MGTSRQGSIVTLLLGGAALAVIVLGVSLVPACGDEECLAYNENCTQDYKLSEYGRTDIQCCEGTCQEGTSSGVLICK